MRLAAQINEKILESNIVWRFSVSSGMDQIYSEKIVQRLKSNKNLQQFMCPENTRTRR